MASRMFVDIQNMSVGRVFTVQFRQPVQFRLDGGQLIAQRFRKKIICQTALSVVRTELTPAAQQPVLVARLGAEIAQALAEVGNTHNRESCSQRALILTQA